MVYAKVKGKMSKLDQEDLTEPKMSKKTMAKEEAKEAKTRMKPKMGMKKIKAMY